MDTVSQARRDTVEVVDGVHLTQLAAGDRMSVQHFHIEPGATVPEHSHHHEQVGFVYTGAMTFRIGTAASDGQGGSDDDRVELVVGANESFVIPSEEPHAAENPRSDPVRGIDVFAPPRPDPDWEE